MKITSELKHKLVDISTVKPWLASARLKELLPTLEVSDTVEEVKNTPTPKNTLCGTSRMKILAVPNDTKNGFKILSDFNKGILTEWFKKYKSFEIIPVTHDSKKSRGYFEGAVVPAYCQWQYNIDPREPNKSESRRFLFKRDFHSEIETDRAGNPVKTPQSSKGMLNDILARYTEWATENGAPVPNPELYKLYRDKWKIDPRFPTFHDFLSFLKIEEDAMPSNETLAKLEDKVEDKVPEYPDPQDFKMPTF